METKTSKQILERLLLDFLETNHRHTYRTGEFASLTFAIESYGDARVREAMEGAEDKIESAIKGVYSEDIWLPLPEEQERAKDAVAADVLRTLAPALAKIAVEAIQN